MAEEFHKYFNGTVEMNKECVDSLNDVDILFE